MAALRAQGFSVALLTMREALAIEPGLDPALLACVHAPLRAQANPVKATRALIGAARRHGASIFTRHEATRVRSEGGGFVVCTQAGPTFDTGALVLAAGAWCGKLGEMLGLRIPVVPVRGQMWASAPMPPCLFQTITAMESALSWSREALEHGALPPRLTHRDGGRRTRHLYGRQTADGAVIFGGDRQAVGFDRAPDRSGIDANFAHAAEVLPLLTKAAVVRTWAGLMPFTQDGEPLIGRLPGHDRLFVASGLASSGFGRGPMAGKLLAEAICTGGSALLSASDPSRCVTPL